MRHVRLAQHPRFPEIPRDSPRFPEIPREYLHVGDRLARAVVQRHHLAGRAGRAVNGCISQCERTGLCERGGEGKGPRVQRHLDALRGALSPPLSPPLSATPPPTSGTLTPFEARCPFGVGGEATYHSLMEELTPLSAVRSPPSNRRQGGR